MYLSMENRITDLKLQKNNPDRVNVYLDGEYAFGLARIVAAWMEVGQTLNFEKIRKLQTEDEIESAYQKAIRFISYRPRTSAEVYKKLETQNIQADVIEQVLERLVRNHHLDDKQFADLWIDNRLAHRPRSRRVLRLELKTKGIDEETITAAFEGIEEESNVALQAGLKYLPKVKQLDWQQFRIKVSAYLARKGFSYDIIAEVLPQLWEKYPLLANHKNYG